MSYRIKALHSTDRSFERPTMYTTQTAFFNFKEGELQGSRLRAQQHEHR